MSTLAPKAAHLALVALLAACGGRDTAEPQDVYGSGWSAVHADAGNADYSPLPGAADLQPVWSRSFTGRCVPHLPFCINLGPTSDAQGQTYVVLNALSGCVLFALDSATGDTIWCSDEVDRFASISSPLIDREGHLYLADSEAMHAFDRDGSLLWESPIVGVPLSAHFTPGGNLIFITHIGHVHVLRRNDGSPVMPAVVLAPGLQYESGENVLSCATGRPQCPSANTPAIDLTSGRFIFTWWEPGAPQSGVRAMQLTEGASPLLTPLWSNESMSGGSASSPTLSADGSRVYVTDNGRELHALDAATGETIWRFDIGYAAAGSPSVSPHGLIMPAGGGALSGGGRVLAVQDRGDHAALAWRQGGWINGGISTQAAGNIAYVTDLQLAALPYLVVVDTETGSELDRELLPGLQGFTVGTTVGHDGSVYVPSVLGELFAFRPAETSP
ncbi:outer membrane protein assembly factor BamB family protein [Sinimarinibacterium flocculans]|uniref:outer membrane protein assembly factor BamB family protein n=1 Tax=Sinimarinibacterium flocculans TaxID=985250 RepID=UPI003512CF63